jgi:hypothetical protein
VSLPKAPSDGSSSYFILHGPWVVLSSPVVILKLISAFPLHFKLQRSRLCIYSTFPSTLFYKVQVQNKQLKLIEIQMD